TNPPGHDECSDETSAIVSGGAYLLSLSCGQSCADKASDCAQGCMVDGTDLSAACSDCFGALGVCAHDHCASPCATGTDAGCYACLTSAGCEAPFVECAGLPVPGSPADTTCTAADRTAIAASGDITESVGQCVDQCQDGRSCADDCMTVVLDASDRCGATCGGALAVCAATSCHAQCDGTATLGACYACLDASACDDAFTTCSGGVAIEPPAGAVCLGVGDQTQADDGTAWDATATCAAGCVGKAASCIADCVAATQLSDACQPCYAALGTCENDKCASACAGDHAGPECAACLDGQGCVAAFQTCGGRAPYPPVTLGTDTCGAALDCAVACAGSGPATDACVEACVVAAEPGLIPLARRTVECVRDTCKGHDVSCVAVSCLGDYQTCRAITPELGCQAIDGCLAACGDDAGCQLGCFTKAQGADAVSDFLAIDECAKRFCDPADLDTFIPCRSRALAEPAECQNVVHQCADPDFVPEPLACYLLATCINNCPDQPCRDACVAQSSEVAVEDANTFFACVSEQCPSGEPLCVYDKCFGEYHHCYGQEGIAFSCGQIFQCQALDVCDTQSCQESCIGSAADSASAVAFQTVYACFIDQCLGPNGFVPGCIDQVQQPGGACETAVNNCP
ncbi:MAG: hypothetical protein U1F43_33130, partial [Myxococcota bacterium]